MRARQAEIEEAIRTRVFAIVDPAEAAGGEYAGTRGETIAAAIEYALDGLQSGGERPSPVPPVVLIQARLAARDGIGLDTVLRRYFAGYTVLGDFIVAEAQEAGLMRDASLKRLLRAQAIHLDRLLAAVAEEHAREQASGPTGGEQRRAECVERLLDGELVDPGELAYELDAWHLGAVAKGPFPQVALRELATTLDARLLAVERGSSLWAWLGARRPPDAERVQAALADALPSGSALALGECAEGPGGWRFTHRQARAALPIAAKSPGRTASYRKVALLASIHCDELLTTSLHQIFLAPLDAERDGGEAARQTLRAYFEAARHISSTAAALGINRNTVTKRLQAIEEEIGLSLDSCGAEMEAALRLEELGKDSAAHQATRLKIGSRLSTLPSRAVT
jgi:hypothetical protein